MSLDLLNSSECLMKMEVAGDTLIPFLQVANHFCEEVNFHFTKEGLKLKTIDPTDVMLMNILIPKKDMYSFELKTHKNDTHNIFSVGMNCKLLYKLVQTKKHCIMKFTVYSDNTSYMHIDFFKASTDDVLKMKYLSLKMNDLVDVSEDAYCVLPWTKVRVDFKAFDEFIDICRFGNCDKEITIEVHKSNITLHGSKDKFIEFSQELPCYNVDPDKILGDYSLIFNLKWIDNIMSFFRFQTDRLQLGFRRDSPLVFFPEIPHCSGYFALAPIYNDQDDSEQLVVVKKVE